jgi:hypothetical protein
VRPRFRIQWCRQETPLRLELSGGIWAANRDDTAPGCRGNRPARRKTPGDGPSIDDFPEELVQVMQKYSPVSITSVQDLVEKLGCVANSEGGTGRHYNVLGGARFSCGSQRCYSWLNMLGN